MARKALHTNRLRTDWPKINELCQSSLFACVALRINDTRVTVIPLLQKPVIFRSTMEYGMLVALTRELCAAE